MNPRETKAVNPGVWSALMKGVSEESFWDTFVQCMQCKQVTVRQHYATNHKCPQNKGSRDERFHPYRRALTRTDTIPADEPEHSSPIRSMVNQARASTPESTHAYDPEEVSEDTYDESGNDDVATARDFGGESQVENSVHSGVGPRSEPDSGLASESAWPWWLPDAPALPDFEDLPDLASLFQGSQVQQPVSSLRTHIASERSGGSGGI